MTNWLQAAMRAQRMADDAISTRDQRIWWAHQDGIHVFDIAEALQMTIGEVDMIIKRERFREPVT